MLLPLITLFTLWASATGKEQRYTNQWVAEIHGGEEVAQRVARDLGYTYKGKIAALDDHYLLTRSDHPKDLLRDSSHLTRALEDLDEVKGAEQQPVVQRSKRGLVPEYHERSPGGYNSDWSSLMSSASSLYHSYGYSQPATPQKIRNEPDDPNEVGKADFDSILEKTFPTKPAEDSQLETYEGVTPHGRSLTKKSSPYEGVFNDPMWDRQWYLHDYRTKNLPVMDHNVVPVYKMGYTGKDITVMVVDDGVDQTHRDLAANFDASLSYDFCNDVTGCKPDPNSDLTYNEGTMVAGVIGMTANNHKCGVGIAYKAKIAGSKVMCAGTESSLAESNGLIHQLDKVDIYTSSWGPRDDGQNMDKLSKIAAASLEKGVTEGRKKKGAIYIFPSGNGKQDYDNCAADCYVNNVNTIVIAAANQDGKAPFYSERCSAVMATAYSGGGSKEGVVSTRGDGNCIKSATGTPAAVPIATGIIALLLDAKEDLTYRDVMHLIVWGSEVAPLANNTGWHQNGKGLWVSKDFGFGLLNAENMVNLAKNWKHVPKKVTCTETIKINPTEFYAVEGLRLFHDTKACQDQGDKGVSYLEHIELTTTLDYKYRGGISIYVKSPEGTKTTILDPRPNDYDYNGLQAWSIKSVHNWGENPKGRWIIGVKITEKSSYPTATAQEFTITFHGTHNKPNHYNHPKTYSAFRLPDGRTSHVKS